MRVSWLCCSPFKSCKSRPQTKALGRSIRRNREVRDKMHAFWNSARGKHFLGRNGDLDHGLIRQEVGILVLRERGVCILTLNGRGNLPPMNPPRRTTGSEQYFR